MLQWIDPETGARKSRSARTSDPDEAETARADLEYELTHGKYQEASRMSWERFRELFDGEYLTNLRPRTRKRYEQVFNLFEEVARPTRLKAVTERTVSAFAAALRQRRTRGRVGMMPSTVRVTLQFLGTALHWAAEQKLIASAPKLPAVKVSRKKPQPVPAESFERLLGKAPDPNMRTFLLCGWLAGLRLGEVVALRWEAGDGAPYLDPARNRIVLPAEFVKSVEDQWVPLDPALREAMEALPRHGPRVFRFLAPDGHSLTANGVSERVIRLARRAGVKLTIHTLRKGFGCHYAAKVPAQVLQKLMRHGDVQTTMAFYANVDAAVEEAVTGPQRNSSRNSSTPPAQDCPTPSDVSPNPA
jgi:integrase